MKQFTLGKNERLKSRKLIEQLFASGKRFGLFPYRVFYLFEKNDKPGLKNKLQWGVGAGAKNFKKAVDRNRIKRLTREAYRLQKSELDLLMKTHSHRLSVFFIYTDKELPAYTIVKEKTALILQKLITIANEVTVADT